MYDSLSAGHIYYGRAMSLVAIVIAFSILVHIL